MERAYVRLQVELVRAARARSGRCAASLLGMDRRQTGQSHGDLLVGILVVLQFAGRVIDVGLHVEVPVTAEIEQDDARDTLLLALERFCQRTGNGVIGLGRGDDALGAAEPDTRGEGLRAAALVRRRFLPTADAACFALGERPRRAGETSPSSAETALSMRLRS